MIMLAGLQVRKVLTIFYVKYKRKIIKKIIYFIHFFSKMFLTIINKFVNISLSTKANVLPKWHRWNHANCEHDLSLCPYLPFTQFNSSPLWSFHSLNTLLSDQPRRLNSQGSTFQIFICSSVFLRYISFPLLNNFFKKNFCNFFYEYFDGYLNWVCWNFTYFCLMLLLLG